MDTSKLRFTPSHEWVRLEGNVARVGVTDHAQKEISDVVFVELPKPGRVLKQKESAMVVESVKAAFDIYSPMSGKVIRVNEDLVAKPQKVNESPYENGWLFEMECEDPKEWEGLMGSAEYDRVSKDTHS